MGNLLLTLTLALATFQNGDFASEFFGDLGRLFGRLQQSELARAFDQAKPIQCSDLVQDGGQWKQVAFLNDNRKIANWHYDSIDAVKRDPVTFVFSGGCRSEIDPVSVATSYPVQESVEQFQAGRIAFSEIVMSHNDPVTVSLDTNKNAYSFLLPYLYVERKTAFRISYTLTPPLTTSKPEETVAEEFHCKALSDTALTYRFLLCRTQLVAHTSSIRDLGNSGYYVLSDGKEASSSVKLQFKLEK
jgi:hypothetical protein